MKAKAVIFDKDGLMFDTERLFTDAWDYAGEKMGIGPAGFMNIKTLGMNIAMSRELWLAEFGDAYDENALRYYSKEFMTKYYSEHELPVKPGLYELLECLEGAGYKMAVASSSPRHEVERHIEMAGVGQYFMGVVCGDMVRRSKPDPEIYVAACELVGERPEECIALEDSRSGLWAAHSAGCKAIMVPDLWAVDAETERILFAKFNDLHECANFFRSPASPVAAPRTP